MIRYERSAARGLPDVVRRREDLPGRQELREPGSRALRHDEVPLPLVERERPVELRRRILTG
jgi:hypothetical protein